MDRILISRAVLERLFEKYGVNVVLSGHDHVYERVKPKNGTYYFVLGNSGELRYHNLKPSSNMAAGFDTDCGFLLVEIAGDKNHSKPYRALDKSWIPRASTATETCQDRRETVTGSVTDTHPATLTSRFNLKRG